MADLSNMMTGETTAVKVTMTMLHRGRNAMVGSSLKEGAQNRVVSWRRIEGLTSSSPL
jgi:hypothetical protein